MKIKAYGSEVVITGFVTSFSLTETNQQQLLEWFRHSKPEMWQKVCKKTGQHISKNHHSVACAICGAIGTMQDGTTCKTCDGTGYLVVRL